MRRHTDPARPARVGQDRAARLARQRRGDAGRGPCLNCRLRTQHASPVAAAAAAGRRGAAPSSRWARVGRSRRPAATGRHTIEQSGIPAGSFTMGDSSYDRNPADGEAPLHQVALDAYEIDATTVTNADFARSSRTLGIARRRRPSASPRSSTSRARHPRRTSSANRRELPGGSVSAEPTGVVRADRGPT
ncbi:SUMF1/EgtB/PvdO family nonheme iron enzyme [Streptomyces sp. NBC_00120]|uniref:SUMF1/EgtB/PvdO family nonheme iron enzyme n=1 Tax=Streptomyces sp. NBC_00120 TaxID=2975660 RepID=UPI00338EEF8E